MRYAWEVQRGSKRQGQDGRRTRTNIWGDKPMLCRYTGKFRATSAKHTHVNGEKGEGTVADNTPKENIAAKH